MYLPFYNSNHFGMKSSFSKAIKLYVDRFNEFTSKGNFDYAKCPEIVFK